MKKFAVNLLFFLLQIFSVFCLAQDSDFDANRMTVQIDEHEFVIERDNQKEVWYARDSNTEMPSYISHFNNVYTTTGGSLIYLEMRRQIEDCALWSYLFTYYKNEIRYWAFDQCETPLSPISDNMLLTTVQLIDFCPYVAGLDDILQLRYPIALEILGIENQNLVFETLGVNDTEGMIAMDVEYQQFFNQVAQTYYWKYKSRPEYSPSLEVFATDSSMQDKFQALVRICPAVENQDLSFIKVVPE